MNQSELKDPLIQNLIDRGTLEVACEVVYSTLRPCPFCSAPVGQVETTSKLLLLGVRAVCVPGGRICEVCEKDFERKPIKPKMSSTERAHNRAFKAWKIKRPEGVVCEIKKEGDYPLETYQDNERLPQ